MKSLMNIGDLIDIDVLQNIQDQFSVATGFGAIAVDCKGKPVTVHSHFSEFCELIRSNPEKAKLCHQCDAHGGLQATIAGEPHVYLCHAGLVDFAVPIKVSDNYLGAILAGQIRLTPEDENEVLCISSIEEDYSNNPIYKEAYEKLPITSVKKVKAAAQMMFFMANYIVEKQFVNKIQDELNKNDLKLMEAINIRSELEKSLTEAELRALQAQINPHFLFNVLNTIGRLALIENAGKTETMIYSFSDMMRYTLKKNANESVTLREEINHVSNYLSIQKIRLGDRLNYHIDIPEDYYDVRCPFMAIQPLVENSINYVVEKKLHGGTITINAKLSDNRIILSIIDDGDGMDIDTINNTLNGSIYHEKVNSGIGIYNVHKRLMYYYGPERGLKIKSKLGEGTTIEISLPLV